MALLTIAPQSIPPGAVRHSATRTIPLAAMDITIQMTDSAGSWTGTVGNVLIWGVQVSNDGGATWTWAIWQPGHADPNAPNDGNLLPFGTVSRGGNLPSLRIATSGLVLAIAGALARLAIQVDTTITLGAIVTTA